MTEPLDPEPWPAIRTSTAADWPAELLRSRKYEQRVAVVLLAETAADRIGQAVTAIVAGPAAGPEPLVDDVVVVVSEPGDHTAAVATDAGARVEIAPRAGRAHALRHGMAATDADLVVFLDVTAAPFDGRVIAGLLGPLLVDPKASFVKAGYQQIGSATDTSYVVGDRVAELMARPLLAAFWPELSGIQHPLSREWAARRTLLDCLAFCGGYGADVALLVDVWREVGLDGMAQVVLGKQPEQPADLSALGRSAAEVLHTLFDRLADHRGMPADLGPSSVLFQPQRFEGRFGMTRHDITIGERLDLGSFGG